MRIYEYQIKPFIFGIFIALSLTNFVSANSPSPNIISSVQISKFKNIIHSAAVDLSRILPFIMRAGDVFQGYQSVIYNNRQAYRLRIFNQYNGQIRYVFVDQQSGQILR